MGTVTILDTTTKYPLTLMGERAGICWGADISDPNKNFYRGMDCINSGHGRVMEFVNVESIIDGYSARVIREWYTHIGGAPTRLQASTRYIDYDSFKYITPGSIEANPEAKLIYDATMTNIQLGMKQLEDLDIPREDIGLSLPLGMETKIVDKRNLRNLMDMSRNRLCTRAYWEYRDLMHDFMEELTIFSPEWEWIITNYFKPKCEVLGYCPEKKGCGRIDAKET